MNKIIIGNQIISNESPCFIIAEAGVNHNGDINIARKLVEKAKDSGANCVKFQTYKTERVITKDAPKANYQKLTTSPNESQFDMLKKIELSKKMHYDLIDYCKELDILFLSTPYNEEDVDFLEDLDVPAFKLASIHAAEPSFVEYAASKKKPIILSTGMATMSDIDTAIRGCTNLNNQEIILLQCTTNYPSKHQDSNILAMKTMAKTFKKIVGFSDHTQNNISCIAAIALGAKVIEKHFTIDKSLPGPDQSSSLTPDEFKVFVKNIRQTEECLGSGIKIPTNEEIKNSLGMRRSIVAKIRIKKGEIIKNNHLTFKRPSDGLNPNLISHLIGRKAKVDIGIDQKVDFRDLL